MYGKLNLWHTAMLRTLFSCLERYYISMPSTHLHRESFERGATSKEPNKDGSYCNKLAWENQGRRRLVVALTW